MRNKPPHDQTPMVIAYQWVGRIMTVAFEMVTPGVLGLWLDSWLGTKVLFTLPGFAVGITLAVWHLIRMTASPKPSQSKPRADESAGKSRIVNQPSTSTAEKHEFSSLVHAAQVVVPLAACYALAAVPIYWLSGATGLVAASIAALLCAFASIGAGAVAAHLATRGQAWRPRCWPCCCGWHCRCCLSSSSAGARAAR